MNRKRTLALLGAAGLALIAASAGLSILSPLFEYTRPILQRPTGALVSILMMAGALYLALIPLFRRAPSGLAPMAWMVGVGLAMRALYIPSTVILEDDIYRYLWDGAVVAHGFNPYAFAPGEFRAAQAGSGQKPSELRRLAHESGMIIERVNHAEIRTIYPPLAQGIFALAHWLKPWSVVAWRAV
ncbi:MAG: hypothetical protein NTW86_22530, partial [Candidatus Sumerlaeota bacterium]|nr:hypothetical protein [Candidatus Sumerlaeota bacterium]